MRPQLVPADLAPILRFNAGLDVLFILAALALLSRPRPQLLGFRSVILIHGCFLLAFDLYFLGRCVAG